MDLSLGRKLKLARERAGLMQKQVADRAGLSRQTVSDAENDRYDVAVITLAKLLNACGTNLLEFFDTPDLRRHRIKKKIPGGHSPPEHDISEQEWQFVEMVITVLRSDDEVTKGALIQNIIAFERDAKRFMADQKIVALRSAKKEKKFSAKEDTRIQAESEALATADRPGKRSAL